MRLCKPDRQAGVPESARCVQLPELPGAFSATKVNAVLSNLDALVRSGAGHDALGPVQALLRTPALLQFTELRKALKGCMHF